MMPQGNPLAMFLQAFLTQTVVYFVVTGLIFAVVWRGGEERFRGARIQAKKRVNRKQLAFEVKNTLAALVIGTVNAVGISLLYAKGLTKLSSDASAFTWWGVVASFVGFLLFNDLWFYCWHRLLHHPKLFRYVHAVHHKSVDVNPFSAYSFHPVEAFILGGAVLPVLFLVPIYLPVLGVLQVVGLVNNIMSHLGYEFLPRWYNTIPPFRWMNTATFHSLHHTRLNGNYGLFFRLWDRTLGTEVPEYEKTFLERGAALHAPQTTAEPNKATP
jgi:sterol desaturase/sphingolipid hydroxylase (fatty acid hydroxylase superfamily)